MTTKSSSPIHLRDDNSDVASILRIESGPTEQMLAYGAFDVRQDRSFKNKTVIWHSSQDYNLFVPVSVDCNVARSLLVEVEIELRQIGEVRFTDGCRLFTQREVRSCTSRVSSNRVSWNDSIGGYIVNYSLRSLLARLSGGNHGVYFFRCFLSGSKQNSMGVMSGYLKSEVAFWLMKARNDLPVDTVLLRQLEEGIRVRQSTYCVQQENKRQQKISEELGVGEERIKEAEEANVETESDDEEEEEEGEENDERMVFESEQDLCELDQDLGEEKGQGNQGWTSLLNDEHDQLLMTEEDLKKQDQLVRFLRQHGLGRFVDEFCFWNHTIDDLRRVSNDKGLLEILIPLKWAQRMFLAAALKRKQN